MSKITDLSKSRYCKGIQCPKMLWLDAYKPQEAEDILPESVLANGTLVGDLARSYFGEYSLVDFSFDKTEMVNKTNEFIQSGADNNSSSDLTVWGACFDCQCLGCRVCRKYKKQSNL